MTRRRSVKFAVGVVAISAITVGLGAAGAVAASQALSANDESKAVIEDAAGQLGIEPDALSNALKQALKNRIHAAVDAGSITEAQGAELKKRIDSGDGLPLFGVMRHGGHGPGHAGPFAGLDDAAAYLGLTEAQLREQLADKTLAEIAKDRGKSVDGLVQVLATAAEKRIDEAVADGRLTEEHANELKSELDERIEALVNGEHRGHERGFRPGFGHGSFSPRGPPGLEGPHA
jgi:polyhydroxyalkanoate synthesis regulator phasin